MIDRKDVAKIKARIERFEQEREELIRKSRDILKMSKEAIYLVHRNDFRGAALKLKKVEQMLTILNKSSSPKLDFLGAFSVAVQEYVEAKCYYSFAKSKTIPVDFSVHFEDYLLGLCDLTGELCRRAVAAVIRKDYQEVYAIREAVDDIYELFLHLNLRNGELRKKSDAIKWNLRKIEDIIYDIKTRGLDNGC